MLLQHLQQPSDQGEQGGSEPGLRGQGGGLGGTATQHQQPGAAPGRAGPLRALLTDSEFLGPLEAPVGTTTASRRGARVRDLPGRGQRGAEASQGYLKGRVLIGLLRSLLDFSAVVPWRGLTGSVGRGCRGTAALSALIPGRIFTFEGLDDLQLLGQVGPRGEGVARPHAAQGRVRVQRQQALRGGPGVSAAAVLLLPVLPLLLLGQVGQLALPLLLEEAPLGDVVVAAQREATEGRLQVPPPRGPRGADGTPVGVV